MNEIRDIHEPLCRWLDKNRIPFHRNRPDKKTTAIKGDPDFLCTLANRCIYVECKVPGKKPSKDQEERIAYLRRAGNTVRFAFSCEEAILAISGHFGVVNGAGEAHSAGNGHSGNDCGLDRYSLGDMIRRAFLKHGHNSWCSIADDVLVEIESRKEGDAECNASAVKQRAGDTHALSTTVCSNAAPKSNPDSAADKAEPSETDLSGGNTLKPRCGVGLEDAKARPSGTAERQSLSSPDAQNLFIGSIGGKDYVLSGDPTPGGTAKMIRAATQDDLIYLQRR